MILIINSGSSSLKFRIFSDELRQLGGGIIERLKLPRSFLDFQIGSETGHRTFARGLHDHVDALQEIFTILTETGLNLSEIQAVGHRVVHGGEKFIRPTLVTKQTLMQLHHYDQLAPLHNPENLAGIAAALELLPQAKQVAVFDTAFHATLPDYAYRYALPRRLYEKFGVRKYGFHGISHRFVSEEAAKKLKKPLSKINLITCHLGSGSSICAVQAGQSIDTSMGLTPLQGLIMSTRCGDIDPAIPLFMVDQLGRSIDEVYGLLNNESGLIGLTGHADLRDLLVILGEKIPGFTPRKRPNKEEYERARLAVDKLCYDVVRYIGAYTALLGRVDAIVFTAGIGERSAVIRRRIMSRLKLNPKPRVLVVPTNEELEIAREIKSLLG
ncbi:acetate kinase [Patescibacteria group bacterium]|nr:acetate kinase [Patescibacteria group bacterium]MBU1029502.1 acetate kinase [Patescibacteria group bacterium]MBU1915739.1 acetate kinase [Patescibacteria group bacterium]